MWPTKDGDNGSRATMMKYMALPAKTLTADTTNNDVDQDIDIAFASDALFEGAITAVSFNGNTLAAGQYEINSGKLTLKPGADVNNFLRTPATGDVVITATGYEDSSVQQTITAGAVTSLTVTEQPVPGAASGDVFTTQPVITLKDQYGNICTEGPSATANVIATAKAGTGAWDIGGTTTKAAVAGVVTYTDLTCTLTTPGTGAITFTSGGPTVDSNPFNIPLKSAKTLTADATNNDVDNDIEITFDADAAFPAAVTAVSFNGKTLDTSQYEKSSGKVTLKPGADTGNETTNAYLRTPATGDVVITATGYEDSSVSQTITDGAVAGLTVSQQPVPGAASGDVFATQPEITLKDQYGNTCTDGPSATADVVAAANAGTGAWTIGGTTTKAAVAGVVTYTDLTCTLTTPGDGAVTFTSGALTAESNTFTIPLKSAKTLTADTADNNVDHDIEITFIADPDFNAAATAVSFNGNTLAAGQYEFSDGKLTLKPGADVNNFLRTPATGDVVITATGYEDSGASQTINIGALAQLVFAQDILAPAANGGKFARQPIVLLQDQYGNNHTEDNSTEVTAAKKDSGSWTLTGTETQTAADGVATFTGLGATNSARVTGARLAFNAPGLHELTSAPVTLPAPYTPPPLSSNANLSGLTLSSGVLNPQFAPSVTQYTTEVSNEIESITLQPTADHFAAKVAVNGKEIAGGQSTNPIQLTVGENTITIQITAENRISTNTYTVIVDRLPANPTCTVTYTGNGNDSGTVPVDSNNYKQGAAVTVLSNTGNLEKSGHTFAGWNTAPDGSGTDYAAGATLTMGSADITLFAQWILTPAAPEIITGPADQTVTAGQTATFSVEAAGEAPLNYQWQKNGIDLSGATSSTLIITNAQPSDAGSYTCLISNTAGSITSKAAALTINEDALAIITESLPGGTAGKPYRASLAADGGNQPYNWSATDLPAGLTIGQDGMIEGTPSLAGTYLVTVTVSDYSGQSVSQTFNLTVNATELAIVTDILPAGTENTPYGKHLLARGGTEPYTWSAAGLPSGLAVSSNGEISGIPSSAGSYPVTVTVQESGGQNASQTYNITIIALQLTDLLLDQDAYTLLNGETHQTAATAIYSDQSQKEVTDTTTYYSSDPNVAAVDPWGQVTAVSSGTATITASYADQTKTATVTVQDARPSFTLSLSAEPASVVGDGYSQITITASITSVGGTAVSGIPVAFHYSNNTQQDLTQATDEQGNVRIIITAPEIQGTAPVNEMITATAQDSKQGLVEQKSMAIHYLPASVKGTIVNQVTGKPVAGATVSIAADFNNDGNIDFAATSITGEDGKYQITVPRGNFEYQINIQMPVQIGNQTTQLNLTQTASVGELSEVGRTINSANNVSGQLRVADANSGGAQETQPICSVFDVKNVQVVLAGLSGSGFNTSVNVDDNGNFFINNVPEGQYQISYQIKAPDGTMLTGPPSATVNVDSSGQMSVIYSLIDPYGIVTDSATNQPVSGIDMKLYWADTELNLQKGRIPNTMVTLPVLDNFQPNQNRNPQFTNIAGEYAWMVYPDGDYYILAGKEGYRDYSTLEAKPNAPADGTDSYIQDGIIHVGQTIVQLNFKMTKQNSEPPGGGGGGGGIASTLSITTKGLPEGKVGTPYRLTVTAAGGIAPYSWSGTGFPDELILGSDGTISGTPGTAGSYAVSIRVQDRVRRSEKANFTLIVNALPTALPDIPAGNKHNKYVVGYPDGKFYPNKEISRAEIAAILYRVLQIAKPGDVNSSYQDLSASYWALGAISAVTEQGLMTGYPDGTFRPEQSITRAEIASIVFRVKHLPPSDGDADTFIDTQNSWAKGAISAVRAAGIIKGYPDGTFRPVAKVTRAEAIAIVNRMMDREPLIGIKLGWSDIAPDYWAYGEICAATVDH